jgi:hypothetical protein
MKRPIMNKTKPRLKNHGARENKNNRGRPQAQPDCRSNAAKASTLGVKLAGSQRTRNA